MLRSIFLGACLCAVVGGGIWFMGLNALFMTPNQPVSGQQNLAQQSVSGSTENATAKLKNNKNQKAALNLDIESVDLIQGEGGMQLWNLKASWANIRKEDGILIVDMPSLDYFLSDEKGNLQVTSTSGEIDNTSQVMRFIDNVVAKHAETTITSPLLVYNGSEKTMSFLEHCELISPEMSGSAQSIHWRMTDKVIEAHGDVVVHLQGRKTSSVPMQ